MTNSLSTPTSRLYPNFHFHKDYQHAYEKFHRKYRDYYIHQSKRSENENYEQYYAEIEDPGAGVFLIYLPEVLDYKHSPKFLTPIIYLERYKYDTKDNVTSQLYHFPRFEISRFSDASAIHQWKKENRKNPFLSYEEMIELTGKKVPVAFNRPFSAFNQHTVFQLQPDHLHYFAEFFSQFEPFLEHSRRHFLSAFQKPTALHNPL